MFSTGQQIGSYTLLSTLGKGGFGEVWLAEKRSQLITKKVAIKLPLEDQVNLEAIRQEAELWEQASGHANVLPIIDADIVSGQVIIVSEYADGGSLFDKLKREGKLSLEQAVEMTIGVLNGLEFLHHKRIIHRDIKPQNILLQGNTPRLADFGISRAMQTTAISSTIIGTDAYMSPESFEGKRTVQTDIWSVGILFYSLLADKLPFPQEHPSERMFAILTREFVPLPNHIPNSLQQIVSKALAKSPENRYQTAKEMREELNRALVGIEHPTLAKTEVLQIPISNQTVTDVTSLDQIYQTNQPPKEPTVHHPQPVTQPPIQPPVIEFKPVPLMGNEAQKIADKTRKSESSVESFVYGLYAVVGLFGLIIFIAIIGVMWGSSSTIKTSDTSYATNNNKPANAVSTTEMNIEITTTSRVYFIADFDAKSDTFFLESGKVKRYNPKNYFNLSYSKVAFGLVQLKLNGKSIQLPDAESPEETMVDFKITKSNLAEVLRTGKITQTTSDR